MIAAGEERGEGGEVESVVGDEAAAGDNVDDVVACGAEGVEVGEGGLQPAVPHYVVGVGEERSPGGGVCGVFLD